MDPEFRQNTGLRHSNTKDTIHVRMNGVAQNDVSMLSHDDYS